VRVWLSPWIVLLGLALPAGGQALGVRTLEEAHVRDARVSFSAESARRARAVLEAPPPVTLERAVAALALGTSRSTLDLARLEALVSEGLEPEQRAALFALGELGQVGVDALERQAARTDESLGDCLAVALLVAEQRGASDVGPRLERVANSSFPSAIWARAALSYRTGERPGALTPALLLHHELRWRAAQTFGFVDGERWSKVRLRELARVPEFTASVVLGASGTLFAPVLKAHLIQTLAGVETPGALELAARLLPRELGLALASGEWAPPDVATWRRLLDALERERNERTAQAVCQHAFLQVPEVETQAGILLLRAGADLPWKWVADRLEKGTAAERASLVRAVGERGQRELASDLADLARSRPDLGLEGPALVALVRLGHEPAAEGLETFLLQASGEPLVAAVDALVRALHDVRLRKYALRLREREDLPSEIALELAIGLAAQGERAARLRLRAELPAAPPGPTRLAAIEALARGADPADLDILAQLFPLESDLEANRALALALFAGKDPIVRPILQAALWGDDWTVSVLAGGLFVSLAGTNGLLDELDAPPFDAQETDLRRVGFALGEWGGQPALDELLRRRPESDPAVQGAVLGLLSARALLPSEPAERPKGGAGGGKAKPAAPGAKGTRPAGSPAGDQAKPKGRLPRRGG